jgi:ATP-dependent helicase HrpA
VHYGGLFREESRGIFIRQGLLTGEINARANFIARNLDTLAKVRDEEAKQRRAGLVADEDWQARWYLDRLPAELCSAEALDKWFRALPDEKKQALLWKPTDLLLVEQSQGAQFPDYFRIGDNQLALHYRFHPGEADDGVTLDVPIHLLNAIDGVALGWLVPGLLAEKAAALIRALPKPLRRNYVPAPDFARAFTQAYPAPGADSLPGCLARFLTQSTGAPVSALDFNEDGLEPHLRMNIRLADVDGRILAQSRDLPELKRQYAALAEKAFSSQAAQFFSHEAFDAFPEQELPESIRTAEGLSAYPALTLDDDGLVRLQAFAHQHEAMAQHARAVRHLLEQALRDKRKAAAKQLPIDAKLGLMYATIESAERLRADCVQAGLNELLDRPLGQIRTRAAFDAVCKEIAQQLFARSMAVLALLEECLKAVAQLRARMAPGLMGWAAANLADIKAHLNRLVYPGFLTHTPAPMLPHLPRYLKALGLRQERALQDPIKDQARMLELKPFIDVLGRRFAKGRDLPPEWQRFWQDTEELCVQVFAQELGLKGAVSHKRLARQLEALT